MFGYVLPPQDLPEEELNRFRRAYCGLCHTLEIGRASCRERV